VQRCCFYRFVYPELVLILRAVQRLQFPGSGRRSSLAWRHDSSFGSHTHVSERAL